MSFKSISIALLTGLLVAMSACSTSPTPTASVPTATDVAKAPATQAPEVVIPSATQPLPTITALPEPTAVVPMGTPMPALAAGASVNIKQIWMLSENTGWSIGAAPGSSDEHILHTNDGGGTWEQVTPPQPWVASEYSGMSAAMAVRSVDEAYVVYGGGPAPIVVWHTTNAGASWSASSALELPTIMDMFFPSDLVFVDAQHGWLMAHLGAGMNHDYIAIYKTTDGGSIWTRVVDPDLNNLTMSFSKSGMTFINANRGWVTGSTNGVYDDLFLYQTDDGGNTWTQPSLPPPHGDAAYFQITGNMCTSYPVMVFGANDALLPIQCHNYNTDSVEGWLYRSVDGGSSWTFTNLPVVFTSRYAFINPTTGWMIGEKKIYHTTDGGATWSAPKVVSWDGIPWFLNETTGWVAAYNDDRTEYALVRSTDAGQNWFKIGTIIK